MVKAMEAALQFLGMGPIAGKTVAIQGAGLVGEFSEPFSFEIF